MEEHIKIEFPKSGISFDVNFQHFLKDNKTLFTFSLAFNQVDFSLENNYHHRYLPPIYYYPSLVRISDITYYTDKYLISTFELGYTGKHRINPYIGLGIDIGNTLRNYFDKYQKMIYFSYDSLKNDYVTDSIVQVQIDSGKKTKILSSNSIHTKCGLNAYSGLTINLSVFGKYELFKVLYSYELSEISNKYLGFLYSTISITKGKVSDKYFTVSEVVSIL